MDQQTLYDEIVAAAPAEGDTVYVERRGEVYSMALTPPGCELAGADPGAGFPDAWIYWSGSWPADPSRQRVVFEDLLAEMESMAGGPARCRWDLEDPWPHSH